MVHRHFTILGGGIAGLSAAMALARQGHHITVFEKAKSFDPIGAGIQLGPNAVRALQKIGAWDAVEPVTYAPPALHFRSGTSGALLKDIKLGQAFERRFGQPYRVAHRADLHTSLLNVAKSLPRVEIKMGANIDTSALTGQVLAADGMWSKTREKLFPHSAAVTEPTILFRSLIEMPHNTDVQFECVNLYYYPGAHVVHYPAGRAGKLNLVFNGPLHGPQKHLAKAAKNLRAVIAQVPAWTQWTAASINPLPTWHKNNIMLIGDAAHGTLPYLAQGAAMSLEDAAALLITTDPVEFENLRRARCNKLHEQTLLMGKMYHLGGVSAVMRNAGLRLSSDETVLRRMAWIYNG